MFEQEAEKIANKLVEKGCVAIAEDRARQDIQYAFQKGAEFKANEWHYVKDRDLPPKTTLVLIKACGCFILGWLDDNNVWHNDSDNGVKIPKDNIYAWKEIVPPKESE